MVAADRGLAIAWGFLGRLVVVEGAFEFSFGDVVVLLYCCVFIVEASLLSVGLRYG